MKILKSIMVDYKKKKKERRKEKQCPYVCVCVCVCVCYLEYLCKGNQGTHIVLLLGL